ncbi:MAG TPA: type II toxin-antitoxin system HicA family toxin [Candidatus Nanoarchaeia archaeon]|nr:type II toxin-antitoxin system HicA family toxin [Candidatus Nanoarchaeia archaeon]
MRNSLLRNHRIPYLPLLRCLSLSLLKKLSGKECVKILCNKMGFSVVRQKSSHIILRKETADGAIGTVVPNHPELKIGTLKGILELGKIKEEEFARYI